MMLDSSVTYDEAQKPDADSADNLMNTSQAIEQLKLAARRYQERN